MARTLRAASRRLCHPCSGRLSVVIVFSAASSQGRTSSTCPVRAADQASASFADRGVALSVDLPSAPSFLRGDSLRLGIVFSNLLTNALRHTPPGGQVTLSASETAEELLFSVEDTGQGIPQEDIPRIFEKFFRVSGAEEQGTSGLGLAIVKEIIAEHGGAIEVSSTPGKGARFTFALKKVSPSMHQDF